MAVVTIDGPAGSGKSTVAKDLARRLGWEFLDTGAMYRTVTLAALRRRVNLQDPQAVADLAQGLSVQFLPGRVKLDGEDVTEAIRSREITGSIRPVADNAGVRQTLVAWQRCLAHGRDVVTEGRDQGSVVFPEAVRKFFLVATLDARVQRRQAELGLRGEVVDTDTLRKDLEERDAGDERNPVAPLRPAQDALLIDTTALSIQEVVDRVYQEVKRAIP